VISVIVAALYSISRSRISITRTKTKSPQTNGICERFHKTVLNEFYCGAFRKKVYRSSCRPTWTLWTPLLAALLPNRVSVE
jgi:transposase InsO family protein